MSFLLPICIFYGIELVWIFGPDFRESLHDVYNFTRSLRKIGHGEYVTLYGIGRVKELGVNTNRTYKKRVRFNKAKLCYDVLLLYHIRIKDISQTLIYNLDSIHFINIWSNCQSDGKHLFSLRDFIMSQVWQFRTWKFSSK